MRSTRLVPVIALLALSLLAPRAHAEEETPAKSERVLWIEARIAEVIEGNKRKEALEALVARDDDKLASKALIVVLEDRAHRKDVLLRADIIRALGRDGLLHAAEPIAAFLKHKENDLRGNAAVSLEYIGSREKKVISALRSAAGREKDDMIRNHMFRALGRCGVDDDKTRTLLLKKAQGGKNEFSSYGPIIGLAYDVDDKKTARGLEKILKAIGVPGARAPTTNTVKRGVLCWSLAWVGDPDSGKFMREQLIAKLENIKAFWVGGLKSFYEAVALKCEGDDSLMAGIGAGVRGFVDFAVAAELDRYGAEVRGLMDDYRERRKGANFTPRGDNLLIDSEDM